MDQVNQHTTNNNAWTAINGIVYDISNFSKEHPGGAEKIIRDFGINGTQAFSKYLNYK